MKGLYAHVPFCARRCHYCDFVVTTSADPADRASFLESFAREADARRESAGPAPFDTLYLGGGTPSRLDDLEIEALFGILRARFRFAPDAEITIEANPEDVTTAKARLWRALGVNRASVGAQTFDDATLARLNRSHRAQETRTAVEALREAGIENVSLDLILSLPGESTAAALASVEAAIALAPQHVSVYELTVEEGTAFGRMRRAGRLALPPEETALETLTAARSRLTAAGYDHYELLSFSQVGFRSRHNLLYWRNAEYLGLGPGAWSYLGGTRSRVADSHEAWLEKARRGDFSPCESERLDPARVPFESLLLSLRLSEGAEEARFAGAVRALEPSIAKLSDQGLLVRADGRLKFTERGKLFAETVFAELSLPDVKIC